MGVGKMEGERDMKEKLWEKRGIYERKDRREE